MKEQCSNCKYYLVNPEVCISFGECRRFPPQFKLESVARASYAINPMQGNPSVYSEYWCGEYRAIKSEEKPIKKSKSGETWKAYADAYFNRYNTEPVRNAKVNIQLSQLVDRLGAEEAPHVAAYYVAHNSAFYIQRGHSVAQLLVDCEKLRTEWATNRQITTAQARQIDRTQTNQNVFLQLLDDNSEG